MHLRSCIRPFRSRSWLTLLIELGNIIFFIGFQSLTYLSSKNSSVVPSFWFVVLTRNWFCWQMFSILCRPSARRRLALSASMVPDMVPVCVSRLRKWRLHSTASISASSVASMQWRGSLLVFGDARTAAKSRLVVPTPWTPQVPWRLGAPSEGWGSKQRVRAMDGIVLLLILCLTCVNYRKTCWGCYSFSLFSGN